MTAVAVPVVTPTIRVWQGLLIATGLLLLAIGGITALNDIPPERYAGIAVWLIGALILHDAVIAMAVFGAAVLIRRGGARLPWAVLAVLQGAVVIGALVTALVLPEIIKQSIGSANPSILPLDYVANLGWFYLALAVLTVITCAIVLIVGRRPGQVSATPGAAAPALRH